MTDDPEQRTAVSLPLLGDLTYREIHAFQDGVFAGRVGERSHDYNREQHYWRVGWLVGDAYRRAVVRESSE